MCGVTKQNVFSVFSFPSFFRPNKQTITIESDPTTTTTKTKNSNHKCFDAEWIFLYNTYECGGG